ncbi:SDR family NAD(P)-dependent oxidoreductase [Leptolyngbya sp. FACHB-16]|uniref:SDR family NAD(P)-dependent oxidoreductase n=1 Tax=unclassified Leptolyngbya TaxID=2650499 RepID=UPI0018EF72CD|nr:SDR family NAD(P)-dependent oxidoreductase [Leptolyngbya sp. FACHB-16]
MKPSPTQSLQAFVRYLARAIIPTFKKQATGHILNLSSAGGRVTLPMLGLYHASKFAVEGLSETLAQELKPFGIKVTIIEPGGFETDFVNRSMVTAVQMPEYAPFREQMAAFSLEHPQGHVPTGVQAILKVVELPDPPLHLAIGPSALPMIIQKLSSDIEEYQRFEDIWQDSTANASEASKQSNLAQKV